MAREYVVIGARQTITNVVTTLIQINTAASGAGSVIEIMRVWCSWGGAATSQQQPIRMHIKATAFASVLTAATPQKLKQSDPASGITGATTGVAGTAGVNTATVGAGAETEIWPDSFNLLNGWLWVPVPEERIQLGPSTCWGLQLPVAPGASFLVGWNWGCTFRELA